MISKPCLKHKHKHKHACKSCSRCRTYICFHKAYFAYESLLTSFGRGFFSSRCLVLYRRNLHLSANDLKHSSKDCICFTKWLRGQNSNRLSIGLQNDECVCVCVCVHVHTHSVVSDSLDCSPLGSSSHGIF